MILRSIIVWTGSNYNEVIKGILEVNPEAKICIKNKKLLIRDDDFNFNRAVLIDDMVKIPPRENIEEDEFEEEPEL